MSRTTLSRILLCILVVMSLAALVTLIPHGSAATVSDLGYYTLCPFAPWSTLTLLFIAGLAYLVRQHMKSLPTD